MMRFKNILFYLVLAALALTRLTAQVPHGQDAPHAPNAPSTEQQHVTPHNTADTTHGGSAAHGTGTPDAHAQHTAGGHDACHPDAENQINTTPFQMLCTTLVMPINFM